MLCVCRQKVEKQQEEQVQLQQAVMRRRALHNATRWEQWHQQPWFRMTVWSTAAAVSAVVIVMWKPSWYQQLLTRWDAWP